MRRRETGKLASLSLYLSPYMSVVSECSTSSSFSLETEMKCSRPEESENAGSKVTFFPLPEAVAAASKRNFPHPRSMIILVSAQFTFLFCWFLVLVHFTLLRSSLLFVGQEGSKEGNFSPRSRHHLSTSVWNKSTERVGMRRSGGDNGSIHVGCTL